MRFEVKLAPAQPAKFLFDQTLGFVRRRFPDLRAIMLGSFSLVHLLQELLAELLASQAPAPHQLLQALQFLRSPTQFQALLKLRPPGWTVFLNAMLAQQAVCAQPNRTSRRTLEILSKAAPAKVAQTLASAQELGPHRVQVHIVADAFEVAAPIAIDE